MSKTIIATNNGEQLRVIDEQYLYPAFFEWQARVENKFGIKLESKFGSKYIKVLRLDGSVYCFVDRMGNVLKAATWKAPAKGVRGNIFEEGKEGVTEYGAIYFKY